MFVIIRDGKEPSTYGSSSVRVLALAGFGSVRVLVVQLFLKVRVLTT